MVSPSTLLRLLALAALASGLWACHTGLVPVGSPRTLRVPPEMKWREVPKDAKGEAPRGERGVVRLAENGRLWEMELPPDGEAYALKIPLSGTSGPLQPTRADMQLASTSTADGGTVLEAKTAAATRSYLGTLARVNQLYQEHQYELALIELADLEAHYPRDVRLLSMKGTLLLKIGKARQAREAWERALAIDPTDTSVADALQALGERARGE